jgi:hypothetical protein
MPQVRSASGPATFVICSRKRCFVRVQQKWRIYTILEHILAKLVELERYEVGRTPLPSMLIVDSKSVQNADTAKEKRYDGEKTSGVKIHIAVDVLGLLYGALVTTANITDRDEAVEIFSQGDFYADIENSLARWRLCR